MRFKKNAKNRYDQYVQRKSREKMREKQREARFNHVSGRTAVIKAAGDATAGGSTGVDLMTGGDELMITKLEKQRAYPPYGDPLFAFDGTIEDYSELAVMFGFLVLFSITFPFVAVLIYGACLMEIYVDQIKLRHLIRRPFPVQCPAGIGIWIGIFQSLVWFSILCNAGLLVFTARIHENKVFQSITGNTSGSSRVGAWFMMAFFLGIFKIAYSYLL